MQLRYIAWFSRLNNNSLLFLFYFSLFWTTVKEQDVVQRNLYKPFDSEMICDCAVMWIVCILIVVNSVKCFSTHLLYSTLHPETKKNTSVLYYYRLLIATMSTCAQLYRIDRWQTYNTVFRICYSLTFQSVFFFILKYVLLLLTRWSIPKYKRIYIQIRSIVCLVDFVFLFEFYISLLFSASPSASLYLCISFVRKYQKKWNDQGIKRPQQFYIHIFRLILLNREPLQIRHYMLCLQPTPLNTATQSNITSWLPNSMWYLTTRKRIIIINDIRNRDRKWNTDSKM